jgi:hypothetical protein
MPKHITRPIKWDKNNMATVIVTGDWHVGNDACRMDTIERMLDTGLPWVHLGDAIEGIGPKDKRYSAASAGGMEAVMEQAQTVGKIIKRHAETFCGVCVGNHEDAVSKELGDITQIMLALGGVDIIKHHMGGVCYMRFTGPKGQCVTAMFSHGSLTFCGRGTDEPDRDEEQRRIALRRYVRGFTGGCQMAILGHGHKQVIAPPRQRKGVLGLEVDKDGSARTAISAIDLDGFWAAMTPSMFGAYDISDKYPSYAEMKMYPPTDIGWLEVDMHGSGRIVAIRGVS